jgi:class 3 adenylate cyclase/tetratricopeptide (TPR) repeat protein
MADYCVHCGSATRSAWFCEHCGATPASPWPKTPSRSDRSNASRQDEVRPVTALFADIVGSTALGEHLSPEDVKGLVGECVTRMTAAIERYGGVVTSYMGDGVAAFFGLDAAHEDDATRAGLAALEILQTISDCAAEVESVWGVKDLAVRVGVNSGRVGTGLVGAAQPQHLALGDPVNVAARLQGQAPPGSALVGSATAAQLSAFFDLEPVGRLALKGKARSVEAWSLIRYVGERAGGQEYRTRFVGRRLELETLQQVAEELLVGRSHIVILVGDAGVGKTRLLAEMEKRCPSEIQWLRARCFDHAVGVPLGPFVNLIRGWLGLAEDTPRVVSRVRLLARATELVEVENGAIDALCRLMSLDLPPDAERRLGQLAPEALWERMRRSCVQWLHGLAQQGPVVLVLDDFDRADNLTVEVVTELLRSTDTASMTIVLALRPEPLSTAWRARVHAHSDYSHRTMELRLRPMLLKDVEEMVALLDPEQQLSSEVRTTLASQSEGNPLFVEETTGEALHRHASGIAGGGGPVSRLPSALEAVLLARVDRLPASARATAQLAAVCGRRFLRRVVEGALGTDQFAADLPVLLRAGLVREEGRAPNQAYAFTHGLLREAVLSTVTPERMRVMHLRIAQSLEELPDFAERLSLLASHYAASPDDEKALEYLEKAADRAAFQAFIANAVDHYRAALDLSIERQGRDSLFRLSEKLAELYSRVGRFGEALEIWSDLSVRAISSDETALVRMRAARVLFDSGEFDEAVAICDAADTNLNPGVEGELLYLKARLALRRCDYSQAQSCLNRTRELRESDLSMSLRAEIASAWGGLYAATGQPTKAAASATEGLRGAEATGDIEMVLRAKRDLGTVQLIVGDMPSAKSHLEDVYEKSRSCGYLTRALDVASNLLNVYSLLGELSRGVTFGREVLGWVHNTFWRSALLINLAEMESEIGDKDQARRHLHESREVAGEGEWGQINAVHARLTEGLALMEDDVVGAEAIACEVLQQADLRTVRPDLEVCAKLLRAEAAFLSGHAEVARDEAADALALSSEMFTTVQIDALRVHGLVHHAVDPRASEAELWRALDMCRTYSMKLHEARLLMTLGFCCQSESYLDEARELFVDCESKRGLSELRRFELGVPDSRSLV